MRWSLIERIPPPQPVNLRTFHCVSELSPFFSNHYALFCAHGKLNSFLFNRFRTLCEKPPGWGVLMANQLTPGFNVSTFKSKIPISSGCSDVQALQRVLATPFFPLPKASSFSATPYFAPIVQRPCTSHHRIARQGEARFAQLAASRTWSLTDGSRNRSTPTASESSLKTLWAH
jgi:hypothetical protein